MILINGCNGIGTGWSTFVPNYNPLDIIENIKRKLNNQEYKYMKPWYRGFNGEILSIEQNKKYKSKGSFIESGDDVLVIEELPLFTWTND